MISSSSKRRLSKVLKIALGVAWAALLAYGFHINPSASITQSKLQEMQVDAFILLKNGGDVVYEEDVAKYGVASLLRGISFASLSDQVYAKNLHDLAINGWIAKGDGVFCKNGILLRFDRRPVSFRGDEVVKIDMDYSAKSVHYCGT